MAFEWKTILFAGLPVLQDLLWIFLTVHGFVLCRKRKDERERLVSLSPMLLWVGLLCGGILSVPVTLFGPENMQPGVWWILEAGVLLGLAMLLVYCNETVRYDESSFTSSNLLGIKRSSTYSEITGIRRGSDIILCCGRRRIRLDAIARGREDFIIYADRARLRQCGAGIPLCPRRKDPMNGNLDTPWLYFIIYLMLIVFAVVFLVISISACRPADDSLPDDCTRISTSFSSWERTQEEGGTLLLTAPGYDMPFSLSWLSGYEVPVPDPETFCSGETYTLTVREGAKVYFIYAVDGPDQRQIICAYDQNTAYRNRNYKAAVGIAVFSALCIPFAILGILVGRHPESYSVRFRRVFYQDHAWVRSAEKANMRRSHRRRKK